MVYEEFAKMCGAAETSLRVSIDGRGQAAPYIDPPEHATARVCTTDPVVVRPNGILFQRCGGGVRVIRKRIGSH